MPSLTARPTALVTADWPRRCNAERPTEALPFVAGIFVVVHAKLALELALLRIVELPVVFVVVRELLGPITRRQGFLEAEFVFGEYSSQAWAISWSSGCSQS